LGVAGQGGVVVGVEGVVFQPFDGSDEVDGAGGGAVGADEVDFGVVGAGPPAADVAGVGPLCVGEQAG